MKNTTSEAVLTLAISLFLAREVGIISDRKMDQEFLSFLKFVGWTPDTFVSSGAAAEYVSQVREIRAAS